MDRNNRKVHIEKFVFNILVAVVLTIIILYVVDALTSLLSEEKIKAFAESEEKTISEVRGGYKLFVVLRLLGFSLTWVFFVIYILLATNKVKIGVVFTLIWSAIFLINIIGQFTLFVQVAPETWVQIVMTIASSFGLFALGSQFITIIRRNHYKKLEERWGG